jgi:uncharacterized membrane protein
VINQRRSFTISERVERKHGVRVWILPAVTALVAVILMLVFIGDTGHFFNAPSQPAAPPIYTWQIRVIEFGLLAVFLALFVTTVIFWLRRRNGKK